MDKEFIAQMEEKLKEKKAFLEKELSGFAQKSEDSDDWQTKHPDFMGRPLDEEADEIEAYENALPVEHALELDLKNVNLALEKIKKGEYGICENCKKEIDKKRLEVLPQARICLDCKQEK